MREPTVAIVCPQARLQTRSVRGLSGIGAHVPLVNGNDSTQVQLGLQPFNRLAGVNNDLLVDLLDDASSERVHALVEKRLRLQRRSVPSAPKPIHDAQMHIRIDRHEVSGYAAAVLEHGMLSNAELHRDQGGLVRATAKDLRLGAQHRRGPSVAVQARSPRQIFTANNCHSRSLCTESFFDQPPEARVLRHRHDGGVRIDVRRNRLQVGAVGERRQGDENDV
mmetsp:Transcript_110690/g.312134  ORF Transcript_110690/g.312134 Transcript_110690/m.312134 type:complete len:222 (+) Transcript_110690:262-927(+)